MALFAKPLILWQMPRRCHIVDVPTKSRKHGGKAMQFSRTISANGIEIVLLEQGEGPLAVLCHGWPEMSYSWRYQIPR